MSWAAPASADICRGRWHMVQLQVTTINHPALPLSFAMACTPLKSSRPLLKGRARMPSKKDKISKDDGVVFQGNHAGPKHYAAHLVTGPERWKAWSYAVGVAMLAGLTTSFLVVISYAQRDFSTALSEKDVAGFWEAVWKFVVIICVAAPLFSFTTYVESMFVLHWREFLTRTLLTAYFHDHAYFRIQQYGGDVGGAKPAAAAASAYQANTVLAGLIQAAPQQHAAAQTTIDNPDQRICEDVKAFVRSSTSIVISLCKKVLNCIAFASVLWSVSHTLVVFMLVYSVVGTFITTSMFGNILMQLHYKLLACEADVRFALVRVREAAESIAFYGGQCAEAHVISQRFTQVITTWAQRIRWQAVYDLWTNVYGYATILAPSIITAPRYFRGEIQFGDISQASYAFSTIEEALSIIVNNLADITGLAAETDRLDGLLTALQSEQLQPALKAQHAQHRLSPHSQKQRTSDDEDEPLLQSTRAGIHSTNGTQRPGLQAHRSVSLAGGQDANVISRVLGSEIQGLQLHQLTLLLPSCGTCICTQLDLHVQPGQSLLIVGPSGCGKSSLLRALAGLWKRGSGTMYMNSDVFFLPQRPFMPLGNLRQQLLFPTGQEQRSAQCYSDVELQPMSMANLPAKPDVAKLQNAGGHATLSIVADSSSVGKDESSIPGITIAPGYMLQGANDMDEGGEAAVAGQGTGKAVPDDDNLLVRLEEVNLAGLADRVGGLNADCDWAHVLSSGEQQRIAVLRLLLHTPHLAILDEATSAVDHHTEALLYGLVKQRCNCYISVGHRLQLLRYHTHVLQCKPLLDGTPQWLLHTSEDYQAQLAGSTGLTV